MNNSIKKLQCKPNSLDVITDNAQAPRKITTLYMIAQFFSSASAPGLEQRASRDLGSIYKKKATGMRGSSCETVHFQNILPCYAPLHESVGEKRNHTKE